MGLFFAIIILAVIYFLYVLVARGLLWKIIVGIFAYFGTYQFLKNYVPGAENICLTIVGYNLKWTAVIPMFILLLSFIRKKKD